MSDMLIVIVTALPLIAWALLYSILVDIRRSLQSVDKTLESFFSEMGINKRP